MAGWTTPDEYAQWREDEGALARVGAQLFEQELRLTVRLPRILAEKAVASLGARRQRLSWARKYRSCTFSPTRRDAGAYRSVYRRDRPLGGQRGSRRLDAWFIGSALDAADDAGLINAAVNDQ